MIVPNNRRLLLEEEISNYAHSNFFRCIKPFLSWMIKGESYWFEYKGKNIYEVRSDNNIGKNFEMEAHQLLTCFIPCDCETNESELIRYFHWLVELRIHSGYVEDYIQYKEEIKIENN